jgi:hypothetical protein
MPELRVINGGGGGGGQRFKEARYAYALWDAIYPRPANNYEEIADRMSKTAGKKLSFFVVNNTMCHVRKHAEHYGWTIPHARKGNRTVDEHRRYFPVMLEGNSPAMRSEVSKQSLQAGAVSSCKTIASMAEHEAAALDAAAGTTANLTSTQHRKWRAAAAMFTAASQMAREVLGQINNVA